MVNETRIETVNKHINNVFTATVITNDLCETLANELEQYVQLLQQEGDLYAQGAGLLKAVRILRTKEETLS